MFFSFKYSINRKNKKNSSGGCKSASQRFVLMKGYFLQEKQPSSSCKNGCAGVGNVAPSKVTEKYKSNKYHEVNYCYGEGESL